jgi:large subunit ribosomal protein L6
MMVNKYKIRIPSNINVDVSSLFLVIKGPKGKKKITKNLNFHCVLSENNMVLICSLNKKVNKKKYFTLQKKFVFFLSQLNNTVKGVSQGFFIEMKLFGVGYRFLSYKNSILEFKAGLCNNIKYNVPSNIEVLLEGPTSITLYSHDLELLFQSASKLKLLKKPDSYKGKGISYLKENLSLKEVKKG